MQKIILIQLANVSFHIEENAHKLLKDYLESIQSNPNLAESGPQIELKLCQMFEENNSKYANAIVSMPLVQLSIQNLGIANPNLATENSTKSLAVEKIKFLRNPSNRVLGGVCSGLAAYFGVQLWVVRIALVLLVYWQNYSFLIYLLLWVAIPKAKSEADKLAMQGKPASPNDIWKSIISTFEKLKNGKFTDFFNPIFGSVMFLMKAILNVARKFTGAGIILVAFVCVFLVFLVFLIYSSNNFNFNGSDISLQECTKLIYDDIFDFKVLCYSTVIAVSIALFYAFMFSFWLIKGQMKTSKSMHLVLIFTIILSSIVSIWSILKLKNEFSTSKSITQKSIISYKNDDILFILPYQSDSIIGNSKLQLNLFNIGVVLADSGLFVNNITLEIKKSETNAIVLDYTASADGKNDDIALQNINSIQYKFSTINNRLLIGDYFKLSPKALWRNQSVKITLEIPENQLFRLDIFMKRLQLNLPNLKLEKGINQEFLFNKTLKIKNNFILITDHEDILQ